MSLLAPVLPAFVGFIATELVVVVIKLWMLGNPAYGALGIAGVIYLVTLLVQGFNSARAARAAIELQFENRELLEQLRAETKIAEASQHDAEQANAAKSKFLAAASHDLRQPIHAQGLFLEVLAHTEMTLQQRELLSNARAASEASSELLNALLDYSRIEAGVIEPHFQTVQLQPIFHKIENELASQADTKNIVYRSRDTRVSVRSDPVLLELILRNLVSNAIRYTQRGGVLIACRQRSDSAVIEVWDTGIGIPLEHQQDVFMEFHQLGNPERDRNKGLGLGLAIAHRLSQTLDHPLSLSSIMARGSVFKLTLPLAPETPPSSRVHAQLNIDTNALRILVIDDDEIVREGMLTLIKSWGFECDAVESIDAALMSAESHRPDMIISDYRLREQRTGREAIASLRTVLGEHLPALIITGDTAPERLREAEQSGLPLLHKPVSPDQLHRKLNEILREKISCL
jgi:signal transduction histidine kinase/ActR/RegA family two-component response regulator